VVSVIVRGNDFTVLHAQPGQYFRLRFMTRDGWWHTHPYSLSAEPRRDYLRFTIKALGDGSRFAARVRPGTRVWMSGPYGAITAEKAGGRKVLLLAGGIGVTPLRALAERLTRRSGRAEVTMLYRANNAADLVLRPELEALAAKGGMRLSVLLGPPGDQSDPLVGTRLRSLLPDVAEREVFVCGPPAFVTAACDALRRCRLPDAQVHAEKFAVEV
jgi:ferredoxin-NADP reductase